MAKILQQLQRHLRQPPNESAEINEFAVLSGTANAISVAEKSSALFTSFQISSQFSRTWIFSGFDMLFDSFIITDQPRVIPRLPWELERLVSAASNGRLPTGTLHTSSGMITNLESYVLSWAAAYVCGATADAGSRLWEAWSCWQGNKSTA